MTVEVVEVIETAVEVVGVVEAVGPPGPATTDAADIITGVFDEERIPALPYDPAGSAAAVTAAGIGADPEGAAAAAQSAAAADAAAKVAAEAVLARDASHLASGTLADARLPVTAQAATLSATYARPKVQIRSTAAMAKWHTALSAIRAGTGFAKVLCIGDSTTEGFGATIADSWPTILRARLNAHIAAVPGIAVLPATLTDPRWVKGAWSRNFGMGGSALYAEPGAGADAVFTPGINCDTFDIYWAQWGGKGIVTPKVDGVSQTPIDTNGGAAMWLKTSYSMTAGTGHTLALPVPTGNPVDIMGVDAYLSTTKGVRVVNAGASGTYADFWVTGSPYGMEAIQSYAPDLTVIMLGINDANNGTAAAAFATSMGLLIDRAQLTGDVILCSVIQSNPTLGFTALEQSYRDQLLILAASKDCPVIDVFDLFGPYSATSGEYADDKHLTAKGYARLGRIIHDGLLAL